MNKIELYVDRDDRLTIDFFYDSKDEYRITQFKGKNCYNVISTLCEYPLLGLKENSEIQEVTLNYEGCILNISEFERVLEKRGTGPIKLSLSKFYEEEKKKSFTPKNVTRKNKYVGRKIIASALILSVLGVVVAKKLHDKAKVGLEEPEPTSITNESELPSKIVDDIVHYDYSGINKDDESIKVIQQNNPASNSKLEIEDNEIDVFIAYEDRSDTEKAAITKAYYGDIIEKYAKMYGLDSKIVTAIATQERGIHSEKKDPGGATGLMQLQNSVWSGEKLTAYNYETQSYETITVNEQKLSDVFYNIKVGCMYFQNCMDYMDGNLLAAVQCYNMGYGNMMKILKQYSAQTGKSVVSILSDASDCGWLEHRKIIKVGDKEYIEHVFSWIGSDISVGNIKSDNNYVTLNISNRSDIKVR